jgi:hypothetical protein
VETVFARAGLGHDAPKEALEVNIYRGMRYGAKGNGFFEEKRTGQAQGAPTWEAGFEALEPHGGVGRVWRVEGQIDGQGTKLGAVLVSFGARGLDNGKIAAGHYTEQEQDAPQGREHRTAKKNKKKTSDAVYYHRTGGLIYGENTCTIFEFPTAITMRALFGVGAGHYRRAK